MLLPGNSLLCGMIFVEPVKDVRDILRRDAAAAVRHRHQVLAVLKGQSHGHNGARRGKFDGIVQNRGEHLPQPSVIPLKESQPHLIVKADLHLFFVCHHLHGADGFCQDIRKVQGSLGDLETAVLEPGKL